MPSRRVADYRQRCGVLGAVAAPVEHAFFASWLVLTSGGALMEAGQVLPVVLVAGLAAWYAVWFVLRSPPSGDVPVPYVLGGGLLWLGLFAVDSSFLVVGLSVLVPYCMDAVRVGLVAGVSCAGGWLWTRFHANGTITWTEIAISALIAISAATAVGYFNAVARQSAERKRLIDEVQAAQEARAAAERRAGGRPSGSGWPATSTTAAPRGSPAW